MARLRVMSVAVRSHVIAYAFFIGDRLEYWGSSNKAAKSPEHALPVVKAWMAKFRPQVMVTERIGQDTRKKPRTISVIEAITQLAVDAPLNDIVVPRVRQFTNRYEEAEAVAERFPAVAHLVPKKPRIWESAPPRLIYFEAIVLGLGVVSSQELNGNRPLFAA